MSLSRSHTTDLSTRDAAWRYARDAHRESMPAVEIIDALAARGCERPTAVEIVAEFVPHLADQLTNGEQVRQASDADPSTSAGAADTRAEWYLLPKMGRKQGPFTKDHLAQISPIAGMRVKREGDAEWVPLPNVRKAYLEFAQLPCPLLDEQPQRSDSLPPPSAKPNHEARQRWKEMQSRIRNGGISPANTKSVSDEQQCPHCGMWIKPEFWGEWDNLFHCPACGHVLQ